MPGGADVEAVFAVPGDLGTASGGYEYARRLLRGLPGAGIRVAHLPLPGSFPHPSGRDLATTRALLAGTPAEAVVLVDGLAYGALPDRTLTGAGRRLVALVHHPLALETGLPADRRAQLAATERAALARAAHVIVTSDGTARELITGYGVAARRITVARPGTPAAARAAGSGAGNDVALLCVGTVTPRKGYGVLVAALAPLRDLAWRVSIVGDIDRAPGEVRAVQAAINRHGLAGRIRFEGVLDAAALEGAYCSSDLFVMASLYEGYGMALSEAMAHGLPIVSTTGGAAGRTVPDGAGLKVPPGDPAALGAAIRAMLLDPELRAASARRSWAAGAALPRWKDTADVVAGVIRAVAAREPGRGR